MSLREICLDTETTGLDPRNGHRIIEIGCVELINRNRTGNDFHFYINPERDVPMDSYQIHGISSDFLQDKPKFIDIAKEFIEYIADSNIVIHNAAFDMKFLNFELRKINFEIIERSKIIDSLLIARKKYPSMPNSLDALCKRFKIDSSIRIKHGALLDATLLSDIYIYLMGGKQYNLFDENKHKNNNKIESNYKKEIKYRKFTIDEDIMNQHKKFIIKKIGKDNLWGYK